MQDYLNFNSLNQALLQCKIGEVYDIIIDESKWIADDLILDEGCAFKGGGLLSKFEEEFKKQHPEAFKNRGITVFLSPLKNVEEDGTQGAGAYSNLSDIDSKNLVIFHTNLKTKESIAHEIAHVAGLEHSFKDEHDLTKEEILNRNNVIHYVDKKINLMLEAGNSEEGISLFWDEWKESYKISRESLNIHYRNLYKFKKSGTDNFMDYYNTRKSFWKFQWKSLQDDILKFYKTK